MNELTNIPVSMIRPCPENPRKKINQEELEELAQSIKSVGLLQPITVRKGIEVVDAELEIFEEYYEIVCGHRRYEAAKLAGLTDIPCIIRELSDEEAYEIMVTENLQRKDVDPFDEADAFTALRERGYDADTLAAKFGKSRTYIFTRLKLSCLIPEFRTMYEAGDIEFSHCLIIARLDEDFQKKLLSKYESTYGNLKGATIRDLKYAISSMGTSLARAYFDTSRCADCPKNTACASLFLDMSDAVCEDEKCYREKTVSYVVSQFEAVAKRNPDFFILDDKNIYMSDEDKMICSKLKELGFRFDKGRGDQNAYRDVKRKTQFDISDPTIAGFSFGWKGFFGPERTDDEIKAQSNSSSCPWKNDWYLDRMANNREGKMAEIRMEIVRERVSEMPDNAVVISSAAGGYNKAVLAYLVSFADEDVRFGNLTGGMDGKEAATVIETMDPRFIRAAIMKFLVCNVQFEDSVDTRFIEIMFRAQFAGIDGEAYKRFMDSARENWHGYGEVTDEMIEEDLKQRAGKSAKK